MNHLPVKSFCIKPQRETSVLSHVQQFPGRGFILPAREARQDTSGLILLHVVQVRLPNGLSLKTPAYLMSSLFFCSNPQGLEHEYICQDWEKNKLTWCQQVPWCPWEGSFSSSLNLSPTWDFPNERSLSASRWKNCQFNRIYHTGLWGPVGMGMCTHEHMHTHTWKQTNENNPLLLERDSGNEF